MHNCFVRNVLLTMSKLRYLLLAVITIVTTWATGQNTLTEQVYWIDNNIGTKKPLGPSVATIDVSQLSKGLHSITTQVKDSKGQWSVPVTKYFIIPKATTGQNTLTEQVYWIDNNACLGRTLADNARERQSRTVEHSHDEVLYQDDELGEREYNCALCLLVRRPE